MANARAWLLLLLTALLAGACGGGRSIPEDDDLPRRQWRVYPKGYDAL